jgi:hypothetical protein
MVNDCNKNDDLGSIYNDQMNNVIQLIDKIIHICG